MATDTSADDPITRVFYVLSWGYAGDHWYSWFAKALNAHPELFALMAHEGSRPKYLGERSRSERPPLDRYTLFLEDMGTTYAAIGDCWSYRPWHFRDHPDLAARLPLLLLLRHPWVWLDFYVDWRLHNMRTIGGGSGPLDHEWQISQHALFAELGLRRYRRDETEIWTTYQGLFQLNRHALEIPPTTRILPLERIVAEPELLQQTVAFLSRDRCRFDPPLLAQVGSWRHTPFTGERRRRVVADGLRAAWPDWKQTACERLVRPETLAFYREQGGYAL